MRIKWYEFIFFMLIIANYISTSVIKIPFKISKADTSLNKKIEKVVEDMSFNFKLFSLIDLGDPLQTIEATFDLKMSNCFISNSCRNCSSFYSYQKSKSFSKINTDEKPLLYGSTFYANESFYFYNENDNKKLVENILIYLPKLQEGASNKKQNINNCLNLGLKFPDYSNNNFQSSFIQQLKHKNEINQYMWTMIFYNDNDKLNKGYDGTFIFGDIFNYYYRNIDDGKDFSFNKIVHTYTGSRKLKKSHKQEIILEWGIQFDEIYYNNIFNGNSNKVNLKYLIAEFDFNINVIYGTNNFYDNIKKDFFNIYINKNICKESYMRNKMYKFIYCYSQNFTKNDLEKFPVLNFKNKILRYIFTLDYKELFSLTYDKKYLIFNIMIFNILNGINSNSEQRWVFGLPFWKKYQFSFDIDNKLIYFYNKNGDFFDEIQIRSKHSINNNNKNLGNNNNNGTYIDYEKGIINGDNSKYIEIKKEKIIIFIILIVIFIILFYFSILLIKKLLIKRGYIIMRMKKANELIDDYDYNSKDINNINNNNGLLNKECEMQVK